MEYGYDLINSNGSTSTWFPAVSNIRQPEPSTLLTTGMSIFRPGGQTDEHHASGPSPGAGADFLIWNDRGTSNTGFSIFDTFTRFQNGTTIVAEKDLLAPRTKIKPTPTLQNATNCSKTSWAAQIPRKSQFRDPDPGGHRL